MRAACGSSLFQTWFTEASATEVAVCFLTAAGNQKGITIAPRPSVANAKTLPSGPTLPPVNQVRPCVIVALDKWPSNTPPLFGTEYKKLSPKSNAACQPTASQSEPVRLSVKAHNSPVKKMLITPIQFSPGFVLWTAAKISERTIAAGQKPIPSASVYCV